MKLTELDLSAAISVTLLVAGVWLVVVGISDLVWLRGIGWRRGW